MAIGDTITIVALSSFAYISGFFLQKYTFRGFADFVSFYKKIEKRGFKVLTYKNNDIIELKKTLHSSMPWIIHGFRGNCNVLKNVLNAPNIYISIGEKFNADAVKLIPNDRILLETDESDMDIDTICEKLLAMAVSRH